MFHKRKYDIFKNTGAGDLSNNWRNETTTTPSIHPDFYEESVPRVRTHQSFGMILFATTKLNRWYLGVRRCFTIGFEDMVRARYSKQLIPQLLEDMTIMERQEFCLMLMVVRSSHLDDSDKAESSFQVLWNRLYHNGGIEKRQQEQKEAFLSIVQLATTDWKFWISCSKKAMHKTHWQRPALEFPKGRKESKSETEKSCREREVQEETHLVFGQDYDYYASIKPMHESFIGMNGLLYRYNYAVGQVKSESHVHPETMLETWKKQKVLELGMELEPKNLDSKDLDSGPEILEFDLSEMKQKFEIGSIAWYSESVLIDEIRPTHICRRDIIRQIHKLLQP